MLLDRFGFRQASVGGGGGGGRDIESLDLGMNRKYELVWSGMSYLRALGQGWLLVNVHT